MARLLKAWFCASNQTEDRKNRILWPYKDISDLCSLAPLYSLLLSPTFLWRVLFCALWNAPAPRVSAPSCLAIHFETVLASIKAFILIFNPLAVGESVFAGALWWRSTGESVHYYKSWHLSISRPPIFNLFMFVTNMSAVVNHGVSLEGYFARAWNLQLLGLSTSPALKSIQVDRVSHLPVISLYAFREIWHSDIILNTPGVGVLLCESVKQLVFLRTI